MENKAKKIIGGSIAGLLIIAVFLFANQAYAAIAYVTITGVNNQSSNNPQTLSVTSTAGNELVCFVGTSGPTTTSVTSVDTWRKSIDNFAWNFGEDSVWTSNNITGGTHTITFNFSGSSSYTEIICQEYSGVKVAASGGEIDQINHGTGQSTTPSPGVLNTTSANEVIVGQVWTGGSPTYTAASGFTKRSVVSVDPQGEDQVVSSTGAYTASWTLNGSQFWGATAISFIAASTPVVVGPPVVLIKSTTQIKGSVIIK